MAMAESNQQASIGFRAPERDDSIRSTASTDQLMSGEVLKPGSEVRVAAFPATSGGYGYQELEPPMVHTDEETKPRSEEQSTTEAFYDAPVAGSDRESGETFQDGSGAMLMKSENAAQEPSAGGYGGVSEEDPPAHKIHTDNELLPKPRSNPYAGEESAESYQDSREAELESFDDTSEHAVEPAPEHGVEHPAKKEGFIAKMMEKLPGHHKSAETATQEHDIRTPVERHDSASTSPKKGVMAKIKEKLPGPHATTGHGTTE